MTNIYGPGMPRNNVISDILKQLDSNEIKLINLHANRDFHGLMMLLRQSYCLVEKNTMIFSMLLAVNLLVSII